MWAEIKERDTGEIHYRGEVSLVQSAPGDRFYVAYDAMTCQYLPVDRYDVCITPTAPTVGMSSRATAIPPTDGTPGARCIRCGDIGADADLGNVCLECDYDTEGAWEAPTDHAGTPINAGARVEVLTLRETGTVQHTGNVVDDGTITVRMDDGNGTRNVTPTACNVIDPIDTPTAQERRAAQGVADFLNAPGATIARRLEGTDIGRA